MKCCLEFGHFVAKCPRRMNNHGRYVAFSVSCSSVVQKWHCTNCSWRKMNENSQRKRVLLKWLCAKKLKTQKKARNMSFWSAVWNKTDKHHSNEIVDVWIICDSWDDDKSAWFPFSCLAKKKKKTKNKKKQSKWNSIWKEGRSKYSWRDMKVVTLGQPSK